MKHQREVIMFRSFYLRKSLLLALTIIAFVAISQLQATVEVMPGTMPADCPVTAHMYKGIKRAVLESPTTLTYVSYVRDDYGQAYLEFIKRSQLSVDGKTGKEFETIAQEDKAALSARLEKLEKRIPIYSIGECTAFGLMLHDTKGNEEPYGRCSFNRIISPWRRAAYEDAIVQEI